MWFVPGGKWSCEWLGQDYGAGGKGDSMGGISEGASEGDNNSRKGSNAMVAEAETTLFEWMDGNGVGMGWEVRGVSKIGEEGIGGCGYSVHERTRPLM